MGKISGMNAQVEAFAHFLNLVYDNFSDYDKDYFVDLTPYFNGRERGFVLTIWNRNGHKHFAWFEHRNSDNLCVIAWINSRHSKSCDFFTWKDIPPEVYPDKWTVTKSFPCGSFGDAATWQSEQIRAFAETIENNKAA